ncbi:MAG TPA: MOSC domain-containing protein [Nitrososphaeraceae archaeon]
MKVLSVNVGLPRRVKFQRQYISTGIFKSPVRRRLKLSRMNFEGDKQADLKVHGGEYKAVYSYPSEHYSYWRTKLKRSDLPFGMFGENLTTEGMFEDDVNIGDEFKVGSARLVATQPRMPCYKLGIRFGNMNMVKEFMASGRPGIYFKVLDEGEIGAGDVIELIRKDENEVTVKDIVKLYLRSNTDEESNTIRRALRIKYLPKGWRTHFESQVSISAAESNKISHELIDKGK